MCSRSRDEKFESVYDCIPQIKGAKWISVGRLDVNTSGLLLFTNDGDFASRLTHPSSNLDREYLVRVFGRDQDIAVNHLKKGVSSDGVMYRFLDIQKGGLLGKIAGIPVFYNQENIEKFGGHGKVKACK